MNKQKIEIIEGYLDEQQPGFFARTLARKIVAENPGLFDQNNKEIEYVRKAIRYRIGALGKKHLEWAKNSGALRTEFIRDEMKPSEYMANFMQRGETTSKPDWHLPSHHRKVLVMSDIHIPYHSLEAIETAIDYGFKSGIDGIYLNGDVIDFAKISKWHKNPGIPSAVVEVDMARKFFEGISNLGVDVYYKLGNHEDRWEFYILQNAPELHGLDGLQLKKALGLDDFEIELIDSKQVAKFGKLNVIHGHEFGESIFSPVNPARGLFNRGKASVLAGHNHQTSEHQESNLDGSPIVCFSTGCLCDLRPAWRPFAFTKWNHGAAIVEIEEDGNFSVENFRIDNGKVR